MAVAPPSLTSINLINRLREWCRLFHNYFKLSAIKTTRSSAGGGKVRQDEGCRNREGSLSTDDVLLILPRSWSSSMSASIVENTGEEAIIYSSIIYFSGYISTGHFSGLWIQFIFSLGTLELLKLGYPDNLSSLIFRLCEYYWFLVTCLSAFEH